MILGGTGGRLGPPVIRLAGGRNSNALLVFTSSTGESKPSPVAPTAAGAATRSQSVSLIAPQSERRRGTGFLPARRSDRRSDQRQSLVPSSVLELRNVANGDVSAFRDHASTASGQRAPDVSPPCQWERCPKPAGRYQRSVDGEKTWRCSVTLAEHGGLTSGARCHLSLGAKLRPLAGTTVAALASETTRGMLALGGTNDRFGPPVLSLAGGRNSNALFVLTSSTGESKPSPVARAERKTWVAGSEGFAEGPDEWMVTRVLVRAIRCAADPDTPPSARGDEQQSGLMEVVTDWQSRERGRAS